MKHAKLTKNEYIGLLAEPNIDNPANDIEGNMALFENILSQYKSECLIGCYQDRMRFLRLSDRNNKLTHYGEGFNFEEGLKDFFKDLQNGTLRKFYKKHIVPDQKPSSRIDKWILGGKVMNIKAEKDGSFLIGAKEFPSPEIKNIMEVHSRRLITAFESFNEQIKHLNALTENPLAKAVYGNGISMGNYKTARYEVQDDFSIELWSK